MVESKLKNPLLLSILAALVTVTMKFAAYRLTGSVGLLSDALEAFVNLGAGLLALWMLRLAGILPSARSCSECDRPLARPLRFDARLPGFICADCAARDADVIANDVADAIDNVMRLSVADFAQTQPQTEVLVELRSLAATLRRNFLGHELKSFGILAGVL